MAVVDCLFKGNFEEIRLDEIGGIFFEPKSFRCDQLFVYSNKLFNVNEPLLKT